MAIMSPRPSGKRRGPAPRKPSPGNPWPKKLRKLRDELDLTQEEAAAKAGVALRTWISWENDHRQPSGPETARSRADELRRIHEHLIREKDNKISATVNEFRITLQAKLGKEYDEQISSAGATASAAEAEAQTAEYAYAVSEPPVIPGTELVRWAMGSWYHSPGTFLQDAIGIFEIVSFDSKFPENLSEYSRPKVGSYIVRLLKKDGTPSLKFDKYNNLGSNWLPKGKQPKGAVA